MARSSSHGRHPANLALGTLTIAWHESCTGRLRPITRATAHATSQGVHCMPRGRALGSDTIRQQQSYCAGRRSLTTCEQTLWCSVVGHAARTARSHHVNQLPPLATRKSTGSAYVLGENRRPKAKRKLWRGGRGPVNAETRFGYRICGWGHDEAYNRKFAGARRSLDWPSGPSPQVLCSAQPHPQGRRRSTHTTGCNRT